MVLNAHTQAVPKIAGIYHKRDEIWGTTGTPRILLEKKGPDIRCTQHRPKMKMRPHGTGTQEKPMREQEQKNNQSVESSNRQRERIPGARRHRDATIARYFSRSEEQLQRKGASASGIRPAKRKANRRSRIAKAEG